MIPSDISRMLTDSCQVTDFDGRYIQIKIDNKIVLMRKEDCLLNATQILMLANTNSNDRASILRLMKE